MGLAVPGNLIRLSQPGDDYVCGSRIFPFYDWVCEDKNGWELVTGDGTRHATYCALPLAIRADLSCPLTEGTGEIRQFSAEVLDEAVGQTAVTDGASEFEVPPYSVVLVTYERDG